MKKLTVLHILWSGRSGGAERFVRDIVLYSDNSRFNHRVCFLSSGGWLAGAIEAKGVTVDYLRMKSGFSILSSLKFIRLMRKLSPDIAMLHAPNLLIGLFLLFFQRTVKVFFAHGEIFKRGRGLYKKIYYDLLIVRFTVVLANSQDTMDLILKNTHLTADKVRVLYIGINLEEYGRPSLEYRSKLKKDLSIKEGCFVVGGVGRLIAEKGFDDFIRIAKIIASLNNNVEFFIAGEGPERRRLECFAKELDIPIKLLGDRNDVPELLNIMDVFLSTRQIEAFGIVLLEALAAGVPIVSFKIPGPTEIIKKCGGGMLISLGDINAMSVAVVNLLTEHTEKNRLMEGVPKALDTHFNIRKTVYNLECIFDNLALKEGKKSKM